HTWLKDRPESRPQPRRPDAQVPSTPSAARVNRRAAHGIFGPICISAESAQIRTHPAKRWAVPALQGTRNATEELERRPKREIEDLRVVPVLTGDWEAEVEHQRHRAEEVQVDPQTKADRGPPARDAEVLLDCAHI